MSKHGGGDRLSGFLGNLTALIERLGELAEKGEALQKAGETPLGKDGKLVYGFTIRPGGGKPGSAMRVEPFGNVRADAATGAPVVDIVTEPSTDVFEESDHVLIVAELPGIADEDVQLAFAAAQLTIRAEKGKKKYRKVIDLPRAVAGERVQSTCRNGVLEIKLPYAS